MRLFTARPSCQVLSPDSDDERSSLEIRRLATGMITSRYCLPVPCLSACKLNYDDLRANRVTSTKSARGNQTSTAQRNNPVNVSFFVEIWGGSFEVRLALDGRACRLSRPSRAGEDLLGAQGFERTDEPCGRGVVVSRRRFAARHFFWARAFSIRSRSRSDRSHHEHGGSPE